MTEIATASTHKTFGCRCRILSTGRVGVGILSPKEPCAALRWAMVTPLRICLTLVTLRVGRPETFRPGLARPGKPGSGPSGPGRIFGGFYVGV